MEVAPFGGAKIALLCSGQVVFILRDDVPHIPWPGGLDLPGGGRENDESPETCALRETAEEIGLTIAEDRIFFRKYHRLDGEGVWFFAARITSEEAASIRLGDEGQEAGTVPIGEFLDAPHGIPHLQRLVQELVQSMAMDDRLF